MRRRELLAALGLVAISSTSVRWTRPEEAGRPSPPSGDDPVTTPANAPEDVSDPEDEDVSDPEDERREPEDVQEDLSFDRELDVVSDLGCSPDGNDPCNGPIVEAVEDGVLFRFPPGRYQFDGSIDVGGVQRVGFVGDPDEEVRLLPPEGFNAPLVNVENVGRVGFGNVTVDVTASSTTAGLRFITRNGFRVEDVTYRGRGIHPSEEVAHAFYLAVENPDADGVLRNATARQGAALGHYKNGNGRGGVWIGRSHRGTAYIDDCEFAEFGNNGLYTSRTPGNVRVRGGTFRNNNVSGVRLSGQGSYVTGAEITVDTDEYDGPRTRLDSAFRTRGVVIEQGPLDNPPGARVQECDIGIVNSPNPGPAISVWSTGKSVTVADTTLRADGNTAVFYRAGEIRQGEHSPATDDRNVSLIDVDVRGTTSRFPTVLFEDAPGSVLRNCRVETTDDRRDGVGLVRSPRTLFDGGEIRAGRYPLLLEFDFPAENGCLVRIERPPTLRTELDSADLHWKSMEGPLAWVFPSTSTCLDTSDIESLADSAESIGVVRIEKERAGLHV